MLAGSSHMAGTKISDRVRIELSRLLGAVNPLCHDVEPNCSVFHQIIVWALRKWRGYTIFTDEQVATETIEWWLNSRSWVLNEFNTYIKQLKCELLVA